MNLKNIKKAVVLILSLLLIFSLAACGGKSKLVGTWLPEDGGYAPSGFPDQLDIYSDGTAVADDSVGGTYTVEDGKIVINLGSVYGTYTYEYEVKGSELTLTAYEESVVYEKE